MSEPVRWTPEMFAEHMKKFPSGARNYARQFNAITPEQALKSVRSQPKRGSMNKIEAAYAVMLDELKVVGKVKAYRFEAVTLKLAEGCRYTPDFQVVIDGSPICFTEVKSGRKRKSGNVGVFMEDDARVKLLTASRLYPEYDFVLAWHYKGAWTLEQISK
jgi:hypothetical protein